MVDAPAMHAAPALGERPEEYALVEALSRVDDADASAWVRSGLRWGYVHALAVYHGTLPLVYAHLRRIEEAVPPDLFATVKGQVNALAARSLFLSHDLGRLAGLFSREGLPTLAVKGPPLALQVYGSLALRPFVDIDLVIAPQDFGRMEALLLQEGFEERPLSPFQKALYLRIHRQYTFWKLSALGASQGLSALDVHTGLMPPGYSYHERIEDLFARAQRLGVGGGTVLTPSAEDHLLLLAYHGFKNRWDRLKFVADVAETIRTQRDLDWDTLFRRAEADGGRRVFLLALALASRVGGADLPADALRRVRADGQVTAVAAAIEQRLPLQAHMAVETFRERTQLNLLAQDSLVGKVRYGAYVVARRLSNLVIPVEDGE